MMNFQYHLLEIKLRVIYLFISTMSTFLISYNCRSELIYIIGKPFLELEQTFIFLELTEAFYSFIRISVIVTVIIMVPYLLYHTWSFLIPSFYKMERNILIFTLFFIVGLFFSELLITYFFLLPKICNFLISFEITSTDTLNTIRSNGNSINFSEPLISVELTPRIESYVELLVKIFFIIFLFFQIPLCVCWLYSKKLVDVSSFYSNRKFLCLISLLVSAFVVPPDFLSQLVVALCFLLIFEILIFIGLFFE